MGNSVIKEALRDEAAIIALKALLSGHNDVIWQLTDELPGRDEVAQRAWQIADAFMDWRSGEKELTALTDRLFADDADLELRRGFWLLTDTQADGG